MPLFLKKRRPHNRPAAFVLEVPMWQMFLVIADQLQKQNVDEIIIAKVEQDRQINSHNTVKKLVVQRNSLDRISIYESLQKVERNRAISKTAGHKWRKVSHIRQ